MTTKDDDVTRQASFFGAGRLRPGALQVTVTEKINREQLDKLVARIVELHGCPACGLGGLDVVIRPQDPRIQESFRELEGIADVTILR